MKNKVGLGKSLVIKLAGEWVELSIFVCNIYIIKKKENKELETAEGHQHHYYLLDQHILIYCIQFYNIYFLS